MECSGLKKSRLRNFSDADKNILLEIVSQAKYLNIIENKKTDAVSVSHKTSAWTQIEKEYNASAQTGDRSAKQLAALYHGMKGKARSNLHEDKKNMYTTGGGTFVHKSDKLDEKLVSMLRPQFKSLPNRHDSSSSYYVDAFVEDDSSFNNTVEVVIEEEPNVNAEESHSQVDHEYAITEACTSTLTPKTKNHSPEKKQKKLDTLINRVVGRKNKKDERDDEIKKARLDVIAIEKKIQKQLTKIEKEIEEIETGTAHASILFQKENLKKQKEIEYLDMQIKQLIQ
ncbi:hypothetical protein RN001_003769 [Aquatica leii]|uniref:Regulatory protein zeste n=1 Tax=Aquatica leii TaxID=1421715 RepID=A0AAN7PJ23_9COLE|nr:hypothetical protein RN001_003769 [Aquatica leii]